MILADKGRNVPAIRGTSYPGEIAEDTRNS